MVNGQWSMVNGQLSMVNRQLSMVTFWSSEGRAMLASAMPSRDKIGRSQSSKSLSFNIISNYSPNDKVIVLCDFDGFVVRVRWNQH